jgi:hypothetical protein
VVTHRRNERLVQNNVYLRERVAELNRTIENMAKLMRVAGIAEQIPETMHGVLRGIA